MSYLSSKVRESSYSVILDNYLSLCLRHSRRVVVFDFPFSVLFDVEVGVSSSDFAAILEGEFVDAYIRGIISLRRHIAF